MIAIDTALPGVLILEPKLFEDGRGHFFESFNRREVQRLIGFDGEFVQDNHSCSHRNVIRGLHYQVRHAQGKLVRVVAGEIFDVAVDLRRSSATCGRWVAVTLSAQNKRSLWIPAGFAHAFLATTDACEVLYKTTDYWSPTDERCIRWDDPTLAIDWPLRGSPLVSAKDSNGARFSEAELYA